MKMAKLELPMPKCCDECIFADNDYEQYAPGYYELGENSICSVSMQCIDLSLEVRPYFCPLMEV